MLPLDAQLAASGLKIRFGWVKCRKMLSGRHYRIDILDLIRDPAFFIQLGEGEAARFQATRTELT